MRLQAPALRAGVANAAEHVLLFVAVITGFSVNLCSSPFCIVALFLFSVHCDAKAYKASNEARFV